MNATREAMISLRIRGPAGQTRDIEAVVDTGYNRYLALPPELVTELELPYAYRGWAVLANADEVDFDVHAVTVIWDGRPRYVEADMMGDTPLVGMNMLQGHNLNIDVESGGSVLIWAKT